MRVTVWTRLATVGALSGVLALPHGVPAQGIMDRIRQKAQDKLQQKTDSLQAARDARMDSLAQGVVDKATGAVECLVTNSACIKRAFGKGKTVELVDSTGKTVTTADSAKAVVSAGGVPPNVANQTAAAGAASSDAAPPASDAGSPPSSSDAIAAAVAGGTPMVPGSGPFEGVIVVRTFGEGDGHTMDLPYQVKGHLMRLDMDGPNGQSGSVIMDLDHQRSIVLIPGQRMYMDMSFQGQAAPSPTKKGGDVVFTGGNETIAGYPCDDAHTTDADGKPVDLCLAKGLGGFMRPPNGNGVRGGGGGAGSTSFGEDRFPLKVVNAGHVELQVTQIARKPLDQSLFEVPAGYQKMGGRP